VDSLQRFLAFELERGFRPDEVVLGTDAAEQFVEHGESATRGRDETPALCKHHCGGQLSHQS